jgi:putative transposase
VIDVSGRRGFVAFATGRAISASRACELVKVSRRRLGYVSRKTEEDLTRKLKELAAAHPRYGCRRLREMLRRDGRVVNLKRVRRLCRAHGLLLKQKRRRKRRGSGIGVPCLAEYPNHVWAYDFVEDRTETGRKLRVLTVADEFTRECVTAEVEYRMNAKFVAETLLRLFGERGAPPKFVRSDNGPEFIAKHLMRMLAGSGVAARHIEPGSPWQNGKNERFNGTLRDECLNLETFHNRDHARALIKLFGRRYNERRPHSSLGYQTPLEFAAVWRSKHEAGMFPAATS